MYLTLLLVILGTPHCVTQQTASESADVVLLIDSSNTLGRRTFPSVKMFVNRLINSLPVGPNNYRIALMQYSDDVHIEFQLHDYKAKNPMLNHVKRNVAFKGGFLRTGNALQKVHETFFKIPRRDRNQIVVVTISGASEDEVEEPAKKLQDEGIKIIALGMQEATLQELQSMATHQLYYYFASPRDLVTFSQNMSEVIDAAIKMDSGLVVFSTKIPPLFSTKIPPLFSTTVLPNVSQTDIKPYRAACLADADADVVFIVDEGVSHENSKYITDFLEDAIQSLDVKEECTRIGLVTYGTEPQAVTLLGKETNQQVIRQKIGSRPTIADGKVDRIGKANLGAAINFTRERIFDESAGGRRAQGVKQVMTIITHRSSDDSVGEAAALLKREGVTIFAMGIEGPNATQLAQIASYPPDRNIIKVDKFSDALRQQAMTFQKKLDNQLDDKLPAQCTAKQHLKTGCKDTQQADFYFLVDGSTSIWQDDFQRMKTFLKDVIKLFTIGPDAVRFGVVQYSYATTIKVEFELHDHNTSINLEKAINNINQVYGDTYTGAALTFMQSLLEKARHYVPRYLIVLTDGKAHDDVTVPAEALRRANVTLYAIGVKDANKQELHEIAGSEKQVYLVYDFASLKDIKQSLVQAICSEEACKEMKADIMFLADSSGSIGAVNFEKMKTFMSELVNKSAIGFDQVRVGVVQFSGTSQEEFPLSRYSAKSEILEAIGRMSLLGQKTLTGGALQFVSDYFKPAKGARSSVRKILILITDGKAQDEVKIPAETLRNENVIIYSVGVFRANKTQLQEISGKDKVYYLENFDILKQIQDDLLLAICTLPDEECKRIERLDIVFVLDSSGSIGEANYTLMKNFMIGFVNKTEVGKNQVQFGALKYSDDPETLFYLNSYSTKPAIIEHIRNDALLGQNTYTAKALRHSEHLFSEERGSRKRRNVPQVLIVITDGDSHDKAQLPEVSERLRARHIDIHAVGIKGANPAELLTIAGSKDKFYYVDTFEELSNLSKTITSKLCNASNQECEIKAEIVFLIDGSKRLRQDGFNQLKNFIKKLLDQIGYNTDIKIGMAQFGSRYQEEFPLDVFLDASKLEEKINSISMMQSRTAYIGNALKHVKSLFKPLRTRVTRNIKQNLLVITDGRSYDDVAEPAKDLRREGVDIYAIGVGNIDLGELQMIAGSSDRKFAVSNFSELPDIAKCLAPEICHSDAKATCFVDIVLGFDISSQKPGHHLFHGQGQLEAHLPGIIEVLTSITTLSCNVGTNVQFSLATPMENTNPPITSKLQVDQETILKTLREVVINTPSQLTVTFLDTLWNAFQNRTDKNRSQVLLLFSDGLNDDIEALQQKSEQLRRKGLDGLIAVMLEGVNNFDDLLNIEFGKGFGYKNQLNIGMKNIASRLFEYMDQIGKKTCCCVFCTCIGEEGPLGPSGIPGTRGSKGNNGNRGHFGEEGEPGARGLLGPEGQSGPTGDKGKQGAKGQKGLNGEKGEIGINGGFGIDGEEGSHGLPGLKGEKGYPGQQGSSGPRGLPGDRGQKGFHGDPGAPGMDNNVEGPRGLNGIPGSKGESGSKGSAGLAGSQGNRGADGQRGHPGPPGQKGTPGADGVQGEEGFQGSQGTRGSPGLKGEKGDPGNKGLQGNVGAAGPKGNLGKPGPRGNKGEAGDLGEKGKIGPSGPRGMRGEEGTSGYGRPGNKGSKGQEGFPGDIGLKGEQGDIGISGEPGPKGNRGRMGLSGDIGPKGAPGERGYPGRSGVKGPKGLAFLSGCELTEYVRKNSPCWKRSQVCPLYPTELVFALDVSREVTSQQFEQMREIIIAIVNATRIRESNCPVGARVAVLSYSTDPHYLIRFSDFHSKSRLLQELSDLSYQRSSNGRDIGGAMRFVARNTFKRTLQSPNVRKVAVFFSHGRSSDPVSINTAVLEFHALDILPMVFAFKNLPEVNRAFAIDDSGLFQVINIHQERDYTPALQRFQLCILCYDKCNPNDSCLRANPSPPQAYVDAAFILESSRKVSDIEFKQLKDFLSTALDNFELSSDPETSSIGDRVAVVSHSPPAFTTQTWESPARTEFDLVAYSYKGRMKRHIQESVQKLNGASAVGHALQWTIDTIFPEAPNQRKHKAVLVISVGETSQWDKEMLRNASLRAKCQGYSLFVLSLGHEYDDTELEDLASTPQDQHVVQLGRIHEAELEYAVKFLKPFLHLLRNEINNYPSAQLKRRCAKMKTQKPMYVSQRPSHRFAIDQSESSEAAPLDRDLTFSGFLQNEFVSSETSKVQQTTILGNQ